MKRSVVIIIIFLATSCGTNEMPAWFSSKGISECPFGYVKDINLSSYIISADNFRAGDSLSLIRLTSFYDNGYVRTITDIFPEESDTVRNTYEYHRTYNVNKPAGSNEEYVEQQSSRDGRTRFYLINRTFNKVVTEIVSPAGRVQQTDRYSCGRLVERKQSSGKRTTVADYSYYGPHIARIVFRGDSTFITKYDYLSFDDTGNWTGRIGSRYRENSDMPYEITRQERSINYR